MKKHLLSLVLVLVTAVCYSIDFIAIKEGNWNDGATWGNISPGVGGSFIINLGNVTLASTNTNQASFQGNIIHHCTWITLANEDSVSKEVQYKQWAEVVQSLSIICNLCSCFWD